MTRRGILGSLAALGLAPRAWASTAGGDRGSALRVTIYTRGLSVGQWITAARVAAQRINEESWLNPAPCRIVDETGRDVASQIPIKYSEAVLRSYTTGAAVTIPDAFVLGPDGQPYLVPIPAGEYGYGPGHREMARTSLTLRVVAIKSGWPTSAVAS